MPTEHNTTPRATLVGVIVMLWSIAARVLTSHDPFPGWSGDPFAVPTPILGVTPAISILHDGVLLAAAVLVFVGEHRRGIRPPAWETVLAALGVGGASMHALVWHAGEPQHVLTASAWIAAMTAGLAARTAAHDPLARRLLVAGLVALVAPIAIKGLAQVYIEHPAMMEAFRRDRDAIIASHGWTPDSAMARAYVRRLSQPEATGWFGMANIVATVGAAGFTFGLGLLAQVWRTSASNRAGGIVGAVALLLVSIAAVVLAGSKGGYAAALLGAVLVGVGVFAGRLSGAGVVRLTRFLGMGVVVLVLTAVAVRGLVGTRVGELSVLFRAFYLQGAASVYLSEPVWGVGPGGFKSAYALLKNPLSPEDVSSPHNVLFEFAATLGLFGVAWAALWLAWVRQTGRAILRTNEQAVQEAGWLPRHEVGVVAVAILFATVAASLLEQPLASPETALVRVGGAGLAVVFAGVALAHLRGAGGLHTPVAAAALVVAAHSLIELTPTAHGSTAWVMAIVGASTAGLGTARRLPGHGLRRGLADALPVAVSGGALLAVLVPLDRVWGWERCLRAAYARAEVIAEITSSVRDARRPGSGESMDAVVERVRGALVEGGMAFGPVTPQTLPDAIRRLRESAMLGAASELDRAAAIMPDDLATQRAGAQVQLMMAAEPRGPDSNLSPQSVILAKFLPALPVGQEVGAPGFAAWRAGVQEAAFALDGNADRWQSAAALWAAACLEAPHSVFYPMQAARAYERCGQRAIAARYAKEALGNHEKARLDPTQGLTESQLAEMRRVAAGEPRP